MKYVGYLVISANGGMRVLSRLSAVQPNECAYKVTIDVPAGWGGVIGEIDITLPKPPSEASVTELVALRDHLKEAK